MEIRCHFPPKAGMIEAVWMFIKHYSSHGTSLDKILHLAMAMFQRSGPWNTGENDYIMSTLAHIKTSVQRTWVLNDWVKVSPAYIFHALFPHFFEHHYQTAIIILAIFILPISNHLFLEFHIKICDHRRFKDMVWQIGWFNPLKMYEFE